MLKKSCNLSLKDVDTTQGIVEGYFSAFDSIDSDGDIIQKGAYAKTISERGAKGKNQIKHLRNHDYDQLIGKILHLEEDNKGLFFRSQMSKSTAGRDALMLYQEGIFTEHSVGYQVLNWKTEKRDSKEYTVITEMKLFEGSAVTWGANENTPTTAIKSAKDLAFEIEKLEKALKIGSLSDAAILELIGQHEKALNLLKTAVEAANALPPAGEKEANILLQTFKDTFHERSSRTVQTGT